MAQFNAQTQKETYNPLNWNSTNFNEASSSNETGNRSIFSPQKTTSLQGLDLLQAQEEITGDLWECNLIRSDETGDNSTFLSLNTFSSSQQFLEKTGGLPATSPEQDNLHSPSFLDPTTTISGFDNTFSDCEFFDQEYLTNSEDPFNPSSKFISNFSAQNRPFNSQQNVTEFIDKHTLPQQSSTKNSAIKPQQLTPQSLLERPLRSLNKTESPMPPDPKLHLLFSVPCPNPECKYIATSSQKKQLRDHLFNHLLKNKNNLNNREYYYYTTFIGGKLLASHIDKNYKQKVVQAQEQLKNTKRAVITNQQPEASNLSKIGGLWERERTPIPSNDDLDQPILDFDPGSDTEKFFKSKDISDFPAMAFQSSNKTEPSMPSDDEYSTVADRKYSFSSESSISSDEYSTDFDQGYFSSTSSEQSFTFSDETESPMLSDVEDSTTFNQETLISKQQPRKKRKYNKQGIPYNAYYTIICIRCSHQPQLKARCEHTLITNFKTHLENIHSDVTKEQTSTSTIKKQLQKPELLEKFSAHCPEPECNYIAQTHERGGLNNSLYKHLLKTKKHLNQRTNHSKKSLSTYINQNYERTFVSSGTNVPDNASFTITCYSCRDNPMFISPYRSDLIKKFERHLKKKHSNMTKEKKQTYIDQHLQKPKLLEKFSINCPESECKYVTQSVRKSNLKKSLLNHISTKHPESKKNHSIESVETHVKENCKKIFVSSRKKTFLHDSLLFL